MLRLLCLAGLAAAVAIEGDAEAVEKRQYSSTATVTVTVTGSTTATSSSSSSAPSSTLSVAPSTVSSGTASSTVPGYFQTTPELYAGPTPTGSPAFLAQTNPAPFSYISYIAPQPLETQVPIYGAPATGNIFQLMGQLSHYFANPTGFGVDEFPLPAGANITQLHMLSRHGARYPTASFPTVTKLQTYPFVATGPLAFLANYSYLLGQQIMTPVGKSELFDSGTLHQYLYGNLYPNNGTKIIARTTTQDRMLQSAEYFLAGFFGLGWTQNATIEAIIEQTGFNNSLAGYFMCNNSNSYQSTGGTNASTTWQNIYLANALTRLSPYIKFANTTQNLTITDIYSFQSICAYETVALGYSSFCGLFTYDEWEGYEYSVDLSFAGNNAFQSPTGRAVGIAWVQELRARLQHVYLTTNGGSANITLDSMPSTFPLNQSLYFDFSHDTNIMSILTALGMIQFAQYLSPTSMLQNRSLIVSHLEPFGARLDIEVIQAPSPISTTRPATYLPGAPVTYLHFVLNQRTLSLPANYPAFCPARQDGWCDLPSFLNATAGAYNASMYNYACNGNYSSVPYGAINNGNPALAAVPNSTVTMR